MHTGRKGIDPFTWCHGWAGSIEHGDWEEHYVNTCNIWFTNFHIFFHLAIHLYVCRFVNCKCWDYYYWLWNNVLQPHFSFLEAKRKKNRVMILVFPNSYTLYLYRGFMRSYSLYFLIMIIDQWIFFFVGGIFWYLFLWFRFLFKLTYIAYYPNFLELKCLWRFVLELPPIFRTQ